MTKNLTLVVGATGMLGGEVVKQLLEANRPARALLRPTADATKRSYLQSVGVQIVEGDLKDPVSLEKVCEGVDTVISTASATLSRQPGDSIEAVDEHGQLGLVNAAEAAGVKSFVYVSFPRDDIDYALQRAKRRVEARLNESRMSFTVLHAANFMEVWLSPAFGFDPLNGKVRVLGTGERRMSWISILDVARFAVAAPDRERMARRVIELGGPDPLSFLEIVRIFEELGCPKIEVEFIPESALELALANARDSLEETYAAVMLATARGNVIDPRPALEFLPGRMVNVREYASNFVKMTNR